jgi:hypothetical protein
VMSDGLYSYTERRDILKFERVFVFLYKKKEDGKVELVGEGEGEYSTQL